MNKTKRKKIIFNISFALSIVISLGIIFGGFELMISLFDTNFIVLGVLTFFVLLLFSAMSIMLFLEFIEERKWFDAE